MINKHLNHEPDVSYACFWFWLLKASMSQIHAHDFIWRRAIHQYSGISKDCCYIVVCYLNQDNDYSLIMTAIFNITWRNFRHIHHQLMPYQKVHNIYYRMKMQDRLTLFQSYLQNLKRISTCRCDVPDYCSHSTRQFAKRRPKLLRCIVQVHAIVQRLATHLPPPLEIQRKQHLK